MKIENLTIVSSRPVDVLTQEEHEYLADALGLDSIGGGEFETELSFSNSSGASVKVELLVKSATIQIGLLEACDGFKICELLSKLKFGATTCDGVVKISSGIKHMTLVF